MNSNNKVETEVWKCESCNDIKFQEEEVICWKCGEGEMVYYGKV